jgi:3-deoxy-D-manno-octulosonic-acid transferase
LAYNTAGHAATALTALLPSGEGKLLQSFVGRRGVVGRWQQWEHSGRDVRRPLVWFHAPSVGEGLQARPVIELVRARHPDWQVVYSFFSPSAARFATGLPVDFTDFLPFDTARAARALVGTVRPTALIFSKLDVWPLLSEEAARTGVALGMVSATVGPSSTRRGRLARALLRDAHAAFRAVGAIGPEDAERLVELGFPRSAITVTGDTRYDQVVGRAAAVDRNASLLAALGAHRPTLVAGSTWPSDETVLLPAWGAVRTRVPGARLIVAPHEPTRAHLAPIEAWARGARLNWARLGDATPETDVVVVDRVGVLGELYALATVAWVGGGFHGAGLHSVLEPAAYGAPVVFGPRHENARDAGLLISCGGGRVVHETREAIESLVRWLNEPTTAGGAALQLVRAGTGASERSYELVRRLVEAAGRTSGTTTVLPAG